MGRRKFLLLGSLILGLCPLFVLATSDQFPPINKGTEPPLKQQNTLKPIDKPVSTPKLEIPLPPLHSEVNKGTNNVAVQSSVPVANSDSTKQDSGDKKSENAEELEAKENEERINDMMEIDYKVKTPPKQLYQREDNDANKHLPPIYFKSYYLSLAFKAVKNESLSELRAVLDNYNFLNGQNKDGDTLLIYAVENNSINSARVLLARGAFVNGVNTRGRTALHYAATLGNIEMIKLLLTMGADPGVIDDKGLKAVDYATVNNNKEAAILINKFN